MLLKKFFILSIVLIDVLLFYWFVYWMLMKKRPICGHEKAKYIYFMRKFNTYKSIVMTICMNLNHDKGRKINDLLIFFFLFFPFVVFIWLFFNMFVVLFIYLFLNFGQWKWFEIDIFFWRKSWLFWLLKGSLFIFFNDVIYIYIYQIMLHFLDFNAKAYPNYFTYYIWNT